MLQLVRMRTAKVVCPLLFLLCVLGRKAAWSVQPSVLDLGLVHLPLCSEYSAFEVWEQRKEAFSVPLQICLIFVLGYCRGTVGTEPVLSSALLPVC